MRRTALNIRARRAPLAWKDASMPVSVNRSGPGLADLENNDGFVNLVRGG